MQALQNLTTRLAAPILAFTALATHAQAQNNIVQTAQNAGNFTTLVAALQATGLDTVLSGTDRYTVLAPTDAAFAALPPGTVDFLLQPANLPTLASILVYHVVPGGTLSPEVVASDYLTTVNSQRVDVTVVGSSVKFDNANLQIADILCSNGVIHVIDAVLQPNLSGIPATAQSAGGFETLLAALNAAGLQAALDGDGPFTVFAPTNAAFAPLPVNRLLLPINIPRLQTILKYHVVPGRIFADQLTNGQTLTTLAGQTLAITTSSGNVFVNGIQIQTADVQAANGNIHVIDSVLLPPVF